jgi:hypothetical protein
MHRTVGLRSANQPSSKVFPTPCNWTTSGEKSSMIASRRKALLSRGAVDQGNLVAGGAQTTHRINDQTVHSTAQGTCRAVEEKDPHTQR